MNLTKTVAILGCLAAASVLAAPAPKFAWRGHMLDVSRHFFTVEEVKRTLDLMHEHFSILPQIPKI